MERTGINEMGNTAGIDIKNGDCLFIFRKDGTFSVVAPQQEPDEKMAPNVMMIMAIATLIGEHNETLSLLIQSVVNRSMAPKEESRIIKPTDKPIVVPKLKMK